MNSAKGRNVLLIQPSFNGYAFGDKWKETESLTPPLGLMYLASPLISAGYNVKFIDLNVNKFERKKFIKQIKDNDFILISCYTDSLSNAKKIINDVKRFNNNTIILCGGPHCNMSEEYINGSHVTAIGEAEAYITRILDAIRFKKSLKGIPGLIYKKNGRVVRNPGIMKVEDLDLSKFPALELIDNKNYGSFAGFKIPFAPIMSSRGCPFSCNYCTHSGRIKYRERSVDNVIEEIKSSLNKGYKHIVFCDDNFLLNKRRALKIMDRIIKEKINVKMIIQGRVDSADYELYKKLRKAGVIMIMFGIESTNQDVLDFYNKRISVEKIKEAVRLANKVGILTFGYFIIGAPIETKKHFENNKKFVNDIKLDIAIASILIYIKGSRLWDDACKKGLIKENQNMVFANKKLSNFTYKELKEVQDDFVKSFYKNPRRLLRVFYKLLRLGELSFIFKIKNANRKDFLDVIKGKDNL